MEKVKNVWFWVGSLLLVYIMMVSSGVFIEIYRKYTLSEVDYCKKYLNGSVGSLPIKCVKYVD